QRALQLRVHRRPAGTRNGGAKGLHNGRLPPSPSEVMITVLLVVHMLIAIALVSVILLQKSEGGGLGMGGGGMSGFMTGRSAANLLTRTTAILGAVFFLTSIVLALLSGSSRAPRS